MAESPLKVFEKLDPELLKLVEGNADMALSDGALPRKFKLLIAMALDAAHESVNGVTSLTRQAMAAGATKQEIAEALRVAQYICGAGSIYCAGRALKDEF
ncbi:MAG: carboxymuconolactone decarboxylase family protein [Dehalococcoidales bacterium]|nr:carboxymuconolactone decarboxylase family protein [Dehalococcoidales bacterium]